MATDFRSPHSLETKCWKKQMKQIIRLDKTWIIHNNAFTLVSNIRKYSFLVGCRIDFNPLTPVAVSEPLEMIGRPTYVLACSEPTAPDSDINQTAGSRGRLSMWKKQCMHAAAVCLLRAGQPRYETRQRRGGFPRWIRLGQIRPYGRKSASVVLFALIVRGRHKCS